MHACARAFVRLCQALASTGRPCGGRGTNPLRAGQSKMHQKVHRCFLAVERSGLMVLPWLVAFLPVNVQKFAPTLGFVLTVLIPRKLVGTREVPVYAVFSLFSLFSLLFSGWRGYRAGWLARRCTFSGVCAAPLGLRD